MSSDPFSLGGRRALVTGANAGIGRALALGLAARGADLVLHHLDDAEGAGTLGEAIAGMGRQAAIEQADFADPAAAAALARRATDRHGPIDILIANAATERRRPWESITPEHVGMHVAVNFTAELELMAGLVPAMAERGWGRVVAIGSVLARRPRAETLVYAALKSAQLTAIRAIARDMAGRGVTLNVISPGAIETERSAARYVDAGFRRAVVAKIPAGRHGQPDDCVGPVVMLCSDAGAYVTGADIPVDGGWSIGDAPGEPTGNHGTRQ
jgi:NAD(P)-dependent dehydrogenase (short-subunit alcohol dehydrogenase family)